MNRLLGKIKYVAWLLLITMLVQAVGFLSMPMKTANAINSDDLKLEVKSAILMDASTGQVIYDINSDVALPPASMAKMMTEYLVLEELSKGNIKWDDMVTTSQYAADVIGSGDLLAKGEKLSVRDMFSAMSIYSGNDASVALAEHIAGTEEKFAMLMNEKAKQLGLSDSAHFINATGLSRADLGKYQPQNIPGETLMTAKDSAILAYHILKTHPEVLEFTKIPSKKLRERDKTPMINWNWMLEGNKDTLNFKTYAYPGLDGLKTGSTDDAGYCFTGTAIRNGIRLISVVMGTVDQPKRFQETQKLLDYGFNNFEAKTVITANSEVESLKTVALKKGVKTSVPVATKTDLTLMAKKNAKVEEFVRETQTVEEGKLVAPLKKGDTLGFLTVKYNEMDFKVELVATEDVDKGSWIRLLFRGIKNFFGGLFKKLGDLF